ncbi:hypothetical protein Q1695_004361 [Nippostrongylus brasiliensis]|nr:hypothetical protein Q1695_004361 [Nippostrongylus brasiliensis]
MSLNQYSACLLSKKPETSQSTQIINMRLVLLMASVLFIADGKDDININSLPCPSEWQFCIQAKRAYKHNQEARVALKKLENLWGKLPNSTKRLDQADSAILESLNETSRENAVKLMAKALTAECGALVWAKVDCFSDKTSRDQRDRDMPCRNVYRKISDAITSLVWATEEIHPDQTKKAKVEKIFEDFYKSDIPNQFDVPVHAYNLGQKVLEALKAK